MGKNLLEINERQQILARIDERKNTYERNAYVCFVNEGPFIKFQVHLQNKWEQLKNFAQKRGDKKREKNHSKKISMLIQLGIPI